MTSDATFAQTALNAWKQAITNIDKSFAAFGDEALQTEVAPGRNRVYYLLGHLAAVHDRLLPLLRLGARSHANLDPSFIDAPDRVVSPDPVSPAELRKIWNDVNAKLAAGFATLTPEAWLDRHDAVSPEDFAKEPLRNRLAVLLSRTSHIAMHNGQLRLAIPRK